MWIDANSPQRRQIFGTFETDTLRRNRRVRRCHISWKRLKQSLSLLEPLRFGLRCGCRHNAVEGYVNGKLYFEHVLPERVSGRIGLWSKADNTFRRLHRDACRLSNTAGGALRRLKAAKDYALVASPAALARDENARLLASDWMHASASAMRDRIDEP